MFDRPRCCDWTPLATQQLRLRNLIQITGHNIIGKPNASSIYFTLHTTPMSSPFFTSERSDTPKNAIWPEINIQNITEFGSTSVCVRVWQKSGVGIKTQVDNDATISSPAIQDELLFLWGVAFSGLIQIPNRTSVQLCENALIFQMHGGFFTSYDYIIRETISRENLVVVVTPSSSYKIDSASKLTPKSLFRNNSNTQICDDSNLISRSNNNLLEIITPTRKVTNNKVISNNFNSIKIEDSGVKGEPTEKYQKVRYTSKEFLKSEIRPSYEIKKLLKLHDGQRWIKRKTLDSKDLMDRICMKSAYCLNLDLFAGKSHVYQQHQQQSNAKHSGMGRTLNRLLFQQHQPPDPQTIVKAQQIRRQIEIAKFRCRLLTQERDRKKFDIRHLEKRLAEISDVNIELESWIMSHYRTLSREKDSMLMEKLHMSGQKDVYANVRSSLRLRRVQLLKELNNIYVIRESSDRKTFTINGIYLPDAESYTENNLSVDLSVALGYVAHVTILCALILDVPLRNHVIHDGSRSKIADNIKLLHPSNRIFPLFTKESPPPNELLYGVFLLNQNITQVKYSLGLNKSDLRATLPNLLHMLAGPPKDILHKNLASDHIPTATNPASVSSSSVDLDNRISIPLSKENSTLGASDLTVSKNHRVCRSVGSDDHFKVKTIKSQFNSEPVLSVQQHETTDKLTNNI